MAAVCAAPELTWDILQTIPCTDGCHQYHLFDDTGAHLKHDNIFTHVLDYGDVLDYNYASITSEILNTPDLINLRYVVW